MGRTSLLALAFALLLVGGPADTAAEKLRAAAWDVLRSRTPAPAHLNHARAVEAIMHEFASQNDDTNEWALAGLVHDIDINVTARDLSRHGIVAEGILRNLGASDAVVHAVSAHDDHTGIARTSRLDHALYCADQIYWRIVDAGVPFPSEKLQTATAESLWPGIQPKAGKLPAECAQIGLTMPQALEKALAGMRRALRFLTVEPQAAPPR